MTSFLLLLSFLIHLILFIILYHLFDRVKRNKDEQVEEVEKLLANFMDNIRLENNKLEQKIHENNIQSNINYNHTPPIPTEPIQEPIHETISTEANSQNEGPAEREVKDVIETSIEGRVLQLVQEGKTVDEIAKLLNRGKTEVELLIKLNKQMNS